MKRHVFLFAAPAVLLGFSRYPCWAQYTGPGNAPYYQNQAPSTMQSLERALDAVDASSGWARTPVSVPQSPPTGSSTSRSYAEQSQGMLPRPTRRDVARVMMEGGSLFGGMAPPAAPLPRPAGTAPGRSGAAAQATSTAYSNYQRAENMASRARNAGSRARYNKDKWSRKQAADEAYYDANDADAAANRAYAAAQSGDSQARGYANLARMAADRARSDADRARYNADTIQ